MNNSHTFQRIVAYMIDFIIINLIGFALIAGIPQSEKYKKAQEESTNVMQEFIDKKIDENEYINRLYEAKYTISKESIATSLISVVLTFGYFAGFAFYNKGQTLGKKLLHIKVVSKNGKEASYLQMIARAMIHNSVFASILSIIFILFIKPNQYIYTIGTLEMVQSFILICSTIMIICRKDKKGLHDLICSTKVVEC